MKMTFRNSLFTFYLLLLLITACTTAEKVEIITSLPRSIPEAEGVSSAGIMTFLDSAAVSKHEFHSFIFLRHGKVIAEGWWNPYKPELKHTMYSTSKSFTSTAVGFAVSEKLLTVNDKVISFFPDDLPDTISPFLAKMTVKDLLTMSVGQEKDPTWSLVTSDTNWVKAFLAIPLAYEPGTKFLYNSLATYTLSAIVQKVTGQKVIDYLTSGLFKPLSIDGADWEVDPRGINTGGWGLRGKTEDMAKLGQLYLQKGKWNGKQILPAEWVEEATTFKIDQAPGVPQSKKDQSDWMQGYCYQFWRCRNNAFRADGAYGQYIIVMPDKDAVIAIQAESPDMQDEINLVWKFLLPAIKDEKLPENNVISGNLKQRLSLLALPLHPKGPDSKTASLLSGKTIKLKQNDLKLSILSLMFKEGQCTLNLTADNKEYSFVFGSGNWINGETTLLGPNLLLEAKAHMSGLPPEKVTGSYTWKDDNTLELVLRYLESPHSEKITFSFSGKKMNGEILFSNASGTIHQISGEIN
jgi:CubicO group peptidase (beta-lactamase class C family)